MIQIFHFQRAQICYLRTLIAFHLLQKKDLEATQAEELDGDRSKPDVIQMKNVKWMGNLDEIMKDRKLKMEKEIEEMRSTHEMEDFKPLQPVADPRSHVKIVEKKCMLYETNDEPTLDDDLDDRIL
uniref:Uncharacterized protein n=1 Tax=Setaria digitata TaxID=48799 RepID=A0A915PTA3_9BILA